MKVRMLTDVLGAGMVWRAGEVHDVDQATGKAWCSSETGEPRAEPVAVKPQARAEKRAA